MSGNQLPPFPVDDATLDMLMAAIDPRGHGDPEAEQSSVENFLDFVSELGGSDPRAIEEVIDDGPDGGPAIHVMRDQNYHTNDVIKALVEEIRRLRALLDADEMGRIQSGWDAAKDEIDRLRARVAELEQQKRRLSESLELESQAATRLVEEIDRLSTGERGMKTVYISIGNSDDQLSQFDWACFVDEMDQQLADEDNAGEDALVSQRQGFWMSPPNEPWQNACWCVEIDPDLTDQLKALLAKVARRFRQDSIAWAEATTEFIRAEVSERG